MGLPKAFTFIEIIIVLTILAVMFGLFVLYGQVGQVRADLSSQRDQFVSYLRLAQSDASSGKDEENQGIHIEENSYTIFHGDSFVTDGTGNFTIELPETLAFTNVNLNGGGEDVIFTSPKGETNTYGTIEIFSGQINKSTQITINSLGLVTY
ncbi:MAG: type II secretion system protein [Candidatus Gracilibacteria bacterium]